MIDLCVIFVCVLSYVYVYFVSDQKIPFLRKDPFFGKERTAEFKMTSRALPSPKAMIPIENRSLLLSSSSQV